MIYALASVVTKNCLKEYLLTKYSCEQFNDCVWYLCCDEFSYNFLKNYDNTNIIKTAQSDNIADHNSQNKEQKQAFLQIILNKFLAIEEGLKYHNSVLFLDSDMLFVNKIDENIFQLLENKNIDFIVSPHYTNNLLVEEQFGFYNVGMFGVNNNKNLIEWKRLTENHEKLNLYFEQKPFELVMKNYFSLSLPINYNIGWWRFNQQKTKDRINQLKLYNEEIYFGSLKAVNFHFHVFKKPNGYDPSQDLVNTVFKKIQDSKKEEYVNIINYYEQLSKESF